MPKTPLARAAVMFGLGLAILAIGIASYLYLAPKPTINQAQVDSNSTGGQGSYGGPFTLTNDNGERVTRDTYAGRYLLIYFGYTFCPDVCPTSLSVMTQALDQLESDAPKKAAAIQPLFITVDPERDTVAVLDSYVDFFHPRLVGLTGSQAEIDSVIADYRIYAAKVIQEGTTDYLMDHTSAFVLLDQQGRFIQLFTFGTNPQEMAETLAEIVQN